MKTNDYPRLLHGNFFFGEWMAPDPDDEALHDSMHRARYDMGSLTQQDLYRILRAAEAYCHFAGHPAANTSIIPQLRDLRRAVRSNREREDP